MKVKPKYAKMKSYEENDLRNYVEVWFDFDSKY